MTDATDAQLADADFILSIVPPGRGAGAGGTTGAGDAGRERANRSMWTATRVSPDTVLRIDRVVRETGATLRRWRHYRAARRTPIPARTAHLPVRAGRRQGRGAAAVWAVDAGAARPGGCGLGDEDVLCRHHQGVHRVGRRHDAGRHPRRHRRRPDRGDDGQPAGAAEMADDGQMPRMHSKAYRWVAEMEEIAAFVGEDHPGPASTSPPRASTKKSRPTSRDRAPKPPRWMRFARKPKRADRAERIMVRRSTFARRA